MNAHETYMNRIDAQLKDAEDIWKQARTKCQNKETAVNSAIKSILIDAVGMDLTKNRDIGVWCGDDRINITYIYDVKQNRDIDIEMWIAKKYDVMGFGEKLKPEAEMNNVKVNDIYQIKFNGIQIDILKNGATDITEMYEYSCLCSYLINQFKNKGHGDFDFFQKLDGFYEELRVLRNRVSDLGTKVFAIREERKKYLIEYYKEEFTKEKYFSDNNVIVVKSKSKDFKNFYAIRINSVKTKYFSAVEFNGEIKHDWLKLGDSKEEKNLFFIEVRQKDRDQLDIKRFIENFAERKYSGDKVLLYTVNEWKDYLDLLAGETENIKNPNAGEHFVEKSKEYEAIYYRKV